MEAIVDLWRDSLDRIIREVDRFVREYQAAAKRVPRALTSRTPLAITLALDLSVMDLARLARETERLAGHQ